MDLLIDKDADREPYPIAPRHQFESGSVREWIRGADIRLAPIQDPDSPFASPGTVMWDSWQWMPTERRREVMRKWLDEDEQEQS